MKITIDKAVLGQAIDALYPERDHMAQGQHYVRHIDAMTREGLHSKSRIAGELAARDIEIERLRATLAEIGAQQEPVGEVTDAVGDAFKCEFKGPLSVGTYLYTSPPAQQEPVATLKDTVLGCFGAAFAEGLQEVLEETQDARLRDLVERRLMHALYAAQDTSPPARKPLTIEQVEEVWMAYEKARPKNSSNHESRLQFARAIEAAHGIKETP